ncbi:glycosyltransferase [Calothrix membranacea FACHB-236]|nr:glycosyltransferase [Calothrix membranacea FACHB-236]
MPLISVIIPAFNSEKTIKKTIESVLQQTFTDFEVIIINDGSSDSTLEIVQKINDSRITVYSFDNAGANVSRNRGLYYAKGEFVSFLDADDMWSLDKLESQLKLLQIHPESSVAYSWTNYIDDKSQFLRRGSYIVATGNVYPNILLVNFLENGSNPLIRKQALNVIGGFDESLGACQDWDIYLRLATNYQFVCVSSPQILYRVTPSSLSSNVMQLENACLTVIEKAFNQAPSYLQYLKRHSLSNIYKYLLYKALEGTPKRSKTIIAAKFLCKVISYDPLLIIKASYWKAWLKIIVTFIFTANQAEKLLGKFPRISNITTILGSLKLEI